MKKLLAIIGILVVIVMGACEKYCTCTNKTDNKKTSYEVAPNENCSALSDESRSCN